MCKFPLTGIRVLDPETGAITTKVLGYKPGLHIPTDLDRTDSIGAMFQIPCGQCMECRVAKAREWSVRILHEAQLHKENSFITLTYNDDNLPEDGGLNYKHLQTFMKDLRANLDYYKDGKKVRFFGIGEYGSQTYRPHYHLILFGENFSDDRKEWKHLSNGSRYYRSDRLESVWPYGYSVIGNVTYDSVFYVAKYCTKKIKGDLAEYVYDGVESEKALMSRRPGIGHDFLMKYKDDIYNFDNVVLRELTLRPPVYYDKLFAACHPDEYLQIKQSRRDKAIDTQLKVISDRYLDENGHIDWAAVHNHCDARDLRFKDLIKQKRSYEFL